MRIDNVPARVKRSLTRAHKLCSNDFRFSGWHKPRERGGGTGCVKVDKFYSVFLSSVYIGGINSTLVFNGLVKGCVNFFIRRSRQEWQGQTPHFFFLFSVFLFSRLLYLSVCCCCWIEQPNKSVAGICRRRGKKKTRKGIYVSWRDQPREFIWFTPRPFFSYSVEYRRYWKRKPVQCREKCLINKS